MNKQRLRIDLADLDQAFENTSYEATHYLDMQTGEVVLVIAGLEENEELAQQIEEDEAGRFRDIPRADGREGYRDMELFIDTVENPRFRDELLRAIQGRGAFRRFKDTLLNRPAERERWFAFSAAQVRGRVLEWLESEGIEASGE